MVGFRTGRDVRHTLVGQPGAHPVKTLSRPADLGFVRVCLKAVVAEPLHQSLGVFSERPACFCQDDDVIHVSGVVDVLLPAEVFVHVVQVQGPHQRAEWAAAADALVGGVERAAVFHGVVNILVNKSHHDRVLYVLTHLV